MTSPASARPSSSPQAPPLRRVLVVEDDWDIQRTLLDVLGEEGFCAQAASNGQEALALLGRAEFVPHVILLDMMMPVMNGEEFRTAQRAQPELAGIPVIVVSADNEAEHKAARMEASACLAKPVDLGVLLHTLDDFFTTPR